MTRLYYATYLFAAPNTYSRRAVITFPTGLSYPFNENADGINYTPPLGRKDVLVRNADGTHTLTMERSRSKFEFSATGHLMSMTDEFGNAIQVTYDASSRAQRIADASGSGRFIDLFYGADGRISAVQDHTGRTVQYLYDSQGYLTTVKDPMARDTRYEYVASRFRKKMSRIADHWNREITAMTYDSSGRLNSYTEEGRLYTYTYYPGSAQTSKSDSLGNVFTAVYGAGGQITERRYADATVEKTWYVTEGWVSTYIDQTGARTDTGYFADGRVATVRKLDSQGAPLQHFHYTYDTNFPDKVAAITPKDFYGTVIDRTWQEWKYDYWPAGSPAPGSLHHVYRVRKNGTTLDTLSTSTYDTKGRVVSVADAAGAVTDYTYDASGNLWKVTSPSNNDAGTRPVTTYSYDALGRVTAVTDPLGHATNYTYDALDRITSVTLPKPAVGSPLSFVTTTNYDIYDAATGLVSTRVTDPNGRMNYQAHDQFGRLVRSTDTLGAVTSYAYSNAMLASITDAHNYATSYEYDSRDRLTATVFPDSARETYTYTLDGLLKTKTDRKLQTITYAYDGLKRLKSKSYPGGAQIRYLYTGQSLMEVQDDMTSPPEVHLFAYDDAYRRSSDTQGTRGGITYAYTPSDAAASYSVQGGPTASYTYYPDGSLNTIQWTPVTGQFKYAYTQNSQYQTITLPNGQTRNYSYDDQGRLVTLGNQQPAAGNLATYDYAYDLNHLTGQNTMLGQRVSLTATVPSQGLAAALTKYSYDAAYQLTRAEYPAPTPFNGEVHSWAYDAIGNRLSSTVNASTASYGYQKIGTNPNNWQRLLSDGVSAYTYDANGNSATKTGLTFAWDAENRLTSIGGTTTASYRYDYQGRRNGKTAGVATSYLYDGLNLLRETAAAPVDYLFGPGIDEPIAVSEGGALHYPLVDGLGSVAGLASSVGMVANQYSYDAWGVTRSQSGTVNNAFGYTSREFGEAGLSFYRARFYNEGSGRFLSEDPGFDSANPYSYVASDPLSFADPSGAVRWKKNAPTYSILPTQDSLFYTCGRGAHLAAGCTKGQGSKDPTCQCPCEDGKFRLEITMSLSIQVYARGDDPRATVAQIFAEEEKHVRAANAVFDSFVQVGESLEAAPYDSASECWRTCQQFQYIFSVRWRLAHRAVDRSHSNLRRR